MAGGKETPRQKMIGMMYLVLTALLALNVSKQIVAAFVTINDKLDASGQIIDNSIGATYQTFQKKRAAIKAQKGSMDVIDLWEGKADKLNARTTKTIHFILSQSNEMIKVAEGKSWVKNEDKDGNITELKSLLDISAMDNYDIPTNMFIGGNPKKPKKEGTAILDSIHAYRDFVCELMANYNRGDQQFKFESPEDPSKLREALITANPEDTTKIAQFYRSMTIPEMVEVKNGGTTEMMPWPSAMFDHAPIVAAAAMLTSVKVDVLNAESLAAEYLLSKVDAPVFNFNKIDALPFARTGYINQGDSLDLRVMIAAYDSTEQPKLKYGINDSIAANWEQTEEKSIPIVGESPGDYKVTGAIAVKEKGKETWKPWEFKYTVGKPSGAVSLPEMNVLYRGYENKVKGAVSGYTGYRLSMSGGSISQKGDVWIARPGSGREATINITGVAADGSTASVGSEKFRVRNLPNPTIKLGSLWDGAEANSSSVRAMTRLFAQYPPEIPLNAKFTVVKYIVKVTGAPRNASGTGASLNGAAKALISQARPGSSIVLETDVRGPDGRIRRKNGVIKVK